MKERNTKQSDTTHRTRTSGASCSHSSTHCCITSCETSSARSRDQLEGGPGNEFEVHEAVEKVRFVPDSSAWMVIGGFTVTSSLSTLKGRPKLKLQRLASKLVDVADSGMDGNSLVHHETTPKRLSTCICFFDRNKTLLDEWSAVHMKSEGESKSHCHS